MAVREGQLGTGDEDMICSKCEVDKPKEEFRRGKRCKSCVSEYKKSYYKANKEHIKEVRKSYYSANKVKINERRDAYRKANLEEFAKYQKEYYRRNRDKILAQVKARLGSQ